MPALADATSIAIERWRNNPSLACRELLHLPLSHDLDDQYILSAPQRIVLNKIWTSRSSITVACRGFGKTRMAATDAILEGMLYPGRRIGCLSASFRQAKQIFDEINRIYDQSPILQQCTTRRPIISNDSCRLEFKPAFGRDYSVIIALPLADGTKIRGARFHSILLDEAPHVPEDVFQTVIRPDGCNCTGPYALR